MRDILWKIFWLALPSFLGNLGAFLIKKYLGDESKQRGITGEAVHRSVSWWPSWLFVVGAILSLAMLIFVSLALYFE